MSAMDKVKNALHLNKDHTTTSTTHGTTTGTTHTGTGVPEGTAGPHTSRVANAADPRIDSDLDSSRHTGTTHTGVAHTGNTHGTGVTGAPAYSGTGTGTGTGVGTGPSHSATTTAGPHSSNLLNKADPRIDSDLDGSRNLGAASGAAGNSAYTGTSAHTAGHNTSSNHGPHNSNLANKADPRIDSDLDGSRNLGAASGTNSAYTAGNAGTGYGGTSGSTIQPGTAGSTTTPHNSSLLNKADPRVNTTTTTTHTGHTGTTGTHATHGHHGTSGSVAADNHGARVGPTGAAATGGVGHTGLSSHVTPGSGNAPNTAGPHNSDLLNKVDPRVDSDLNGSKTYGGNKTVT